MSFSKQDPTFGPGARHPTGRFGPRDSRECGRAVGAQPGTGLDILNFFVADVQTGFGPFLAVYLTINGWTHGMIGAVVTASTVAGVLSQVPAGALVDWTTHKRLVVGIGLAMIALGALLIAIMPAFFPVLTAELMLGIPGSAIRAAIAGIALGLVGNRTLNTRVGRNHQWEFARQRVDRGRHGRAWRPHIHSFPLLRRRRAVHPRDPVAADDQRQGDRLPKGTRLDAPPLAPPGALAHAL